MTNKNLFISTFFAFQATLALGQAGFEQYYYLQEEESMPIVPIIHIQSNKNWYAEARYNYEEQNSFSIYGGKSFTKTTEKFIYTLTPIAGGVIGQMNGGSVGLNTFVEYNNFFFSSQSQFTFSFKNQLQDFFYDWSELGYEPLRWFYFGCSIQHTFYRQSHQNLIEPGVVLGFTLGKWTLPIYGFNPFDNKRYFIIGINFRIGVTKTEHSL
jgi:hypothetical protein